MADKDWRFALSKQMRRKMVANGDMKRNELGDRIGVSGAVVGQYINQRTKPSVEVLIRMAEVFDCSVDDLLTNDPTR